MYQDDRFRVPAPAILRRGVSQIPGRPNFDRIAELDATRLMRAGDPGGGLVSANESLALLLGRLQDVNPTIARPQIRAAAASRRLTNNTGSSGGGGPSLTGVYRPTINMPENGTPILKTESIATPAADGSSNVVNSYRVPRGQTLVVKAIWNLYNGPGYRQGAANQMIWRILRDGQPFKGFEGFRFVYGSAGDFFSLAGELFVYPEQTLEMIVIHEGGSALPPAATEVIMGFQGWEYPG